MSTVLERRLKEFVNRTSELEAFRRVVAPGDERIMAVWGGGGLGKSSLLSRMIHECGLKELPKAQVVWTETRNHDYLGIMRTLRDEIGPAHFNGFTDLVNYFTVPKYELTVTVEGNVSVADGAVFEDSSTGDIAGVVIQDLMIPEPRSDMAVPPAEKRARLTDSFIESLSAVLRARPPDRPLVFFFDAVEKMTEDTHNWVWVELLGAVRDDRLPNLCVVLCGRREPPEALDRDIRLMLAPAALQPLAAIHVQQYLELRGIASADAEKAAGWLMATTKGNPLAIANAVDAFVMAERRTE